MGGLAIVLIATVISGCAGSPASQIEDTNVIASSFVAGAMYKRSVGEIVADNYSGAWRRTFVTDVQIRFADLDPIPQGTLFIARYTHEDNGKFLVVSQQYDDGQIAIQCDKDGHVGPADPATQIGGARRGRTWNLLSPAAGQLLSPHGFWADEESFPGMQEGWKLQYVGYQGSVLRFTIQELGLDKQRMGQVEYVHDTKDGKEFVFRGRRLQVDAIDRDGTLHFTTLANK